MKRDVIKVKKTRKFPAFFSVVFFIKKGKIVPFAKPALNSAMIDTNNFSIYGDALEGTIYELYEDDGFTTDIDLQKGIRKIEKHSAKF